MKRLFGWSLAMALVISAAAADDAVAQGFAPRPRPGPSPGAKKSDKKGPAEAAPQGQDAAEADLPPLPSWPGAQSKKLLFLELHGYFRFRSDLYHNFNLGQKDVSFGNQTVRAPFWVPLAERSETLNCRARVTKAVPGGGSRGLETDDCPDNTLTGANIRLRLEPTINVAEKVRVHLQLDIFDNLSLGSTPDSVMGQTLSGNVPTALLTESQDPLIVGRNSNTPSVLIKRAWAEIDTPVGELKVGRMPWHWGMGILANAGACWDCNFGDNVDRIQFSVKYANHTFGLAYDFAGSGPDSYKIDLDGNATNGKQTFVGGGQAVDLEQLDDIHQLVLFAGRMDPRDVIKDKLERGEIVLNYGGLFVWRKQQMDYLAATAATPGIASGLNASEADLAKSLREISAYVITADVWFKMLWRRLYVEAEGLAIFGKTGNVSGNVDGEDPVDILQWGMVLRSRYGFLRNSALKVGFEFGIASGNDAELYDLNRRRSVYQPNTNITNKLREFRFDPDFHVDLILFREILGTVANAMYFKPSVQYDIFDSLGARLDIIYSLAHRAVAYPGNATNLGLEFDLDIFYKNPEEGFYAGLQYGLLAPFAALDRPASIFGTQQNSQVAQTLQARLIVKF